jgi:hypothetical protein
MGGLGRVAGIAAGAAGLGALVIMVDQLEKSAERAEIDRLTEGFLATGDAAELVAKGFENDYNELKRFAGAFAQLAKEDPEAARRLLEAAEAAGASKDLIGLLSGQLDEAAAAEQQMAADTDTSTDAIKGQTDATGEAISALQQYSDEIRAMTDPLFGAMDAITGNREAQLAYQDALAGVGEAQIALDEAIAAHGATSAEAQEATRGLEDAERAVADAQWATVESAAEADSALAGLKDAVNAGDVSVDAFKDTLATWVRQGFLTQEQADAAAESVSGLASQASEADKERVDIPVTTPGSRTAQDQLHRTTNEALKVPTRRNTNVSTSGTGTAMFRIQQVKDKISSLNDKTVHVNVAVSGAAQLSLIQNKLLDDFHSGGIVPGPRGQEVAAILQAGERVISLPEMDAMGRGMSGAGGVGGATYVDNRRITINTGADPQSVVAALRRAGEIGLPITIRGRSL